MPPRDLRRVLSDAWERMEAADQEAVTGMAREVWAEAMSATRGEQVKGVDIICKDCGQKRLYDIPLERLDVLTVAKTLEILQTLTWGKPAEPERRVSITVTTREELAALPDGDLELIAAAPEAEWAEIVEQERRSEALVDYVTALPPGEQGSFTRPGAALAHRESRG